MAFFQDVFASVGEPLNIFGELPVDELGALADDTKQNAQENLAELAQGAQDFSEMIPGNLDNQITDEAVQAFGEMI